MKRFLTIICALSMVALIAMPALAEVQNIKVSGGIDVRGIYRDNMVSYPTSFAETTSQDFYNSVVSLNVDADLTDNVSAHIGLLNERDWGVTGGGIVSNSAYITLKEMMYSPLTVRAGRMSIQIADGLVVGDGTATTLTADEFSVQNEFDTVHAILDYDPLTLVVGTLKLGEDVTSTGDDVDGYIIDAIYNFEDYNATLDTYLVAAHYNSPGGTGLVDNATGPGNGVMEGVTKTSAGTDQESNKTCDVYTLATNLKMEAAEGLTLDAGIGYQFGDYRQSTSLKTLTNDPNRDVKAMSFNVALDYAVDAEYSPKVGVKYLYRSGDDLDGVGEYKGWLPLAEGQTHSVIIDPTTNTNSFNINASMMPADRLTVGLDLWFFNLAKARADATDAVAGSGPDVLTTKKEIGTEIDLAVKYAYTECLSFLNNSNSPSVTIR